MRAFLVGLALASLAACGSSSTGPDAGPVISGVFDLTSVDNKPLPGAFADSTLLSGRLTLAGFWVASGSSLTLFDYGNTTTYTGTFTPTSISLTTKTATVLGYTK